MPIKAQCNSCSASFSVKDEWAGKTVKCPKCSVAFKIPMPRQKAEADPYQLAPPVQRAHNPMLDLLDDAGVESTPRGPVCQNCAAELSPGAIVCVECGYNSETGQQLETTSYREVGEVDGGMSDAEKMIARAEKELEETPVSAVGQDFGDGADSLFIAVAAIIVSGLLLAAGIGTVFVMDRIGENINTALISVFGSLAMYLFCVVWITYVAFQVRPVQGVICLFSGGLYSVIFGFIQGRTLLLPSAIGSFAIVVGIISYLVFANS